jgi:hypothetical protein
MHRWKHNIKMFLRQTGYEGVGGIQIPQNRVKSSVFMNKVMNVKLQFIGMCCHVVWHLFTKLDHQKVII